MTIYRIHVQETVVGHRVYEVDADNESEAIELAEKGETVGEYSYSQRRTIDCAQCLGVWGDEVTERVVLEPPQIYEGR